jgi:hypothetical protein
MHMHDAADSIESAAQIGDAYKDWSRLRKGTMPMPGDIVLCVPEKQSFHMGVVIESGRVLTSTQELGAHSTRIERMLGVIGIYRFSK